MSSTYKISETDWKRWRDLADDALERLHEKVLAEKDFSCALLEDSTVWCWGSREYGVVPEE